MLANIPVVPIVFGLILVVCIQRFIFNYRAFRVSFPEHSHPSQNTKTRGSYSQIKNLVVVMAATRHRDFATPGPWGSTGLFKFFKPTQVIV